MLLFGALAVRAGQDVNWDLRNYHIYTGYSFLTGRWGKDLAVSQVQSFFNPLLYAFSYFLVSHLPPKAFGFAMGAIQGLNFWMIFLIARAVLPAVGSRSRLALSALCAVAATTGAVGLSELGSTLHDLTTASFVLAAVLVYLRARAAAAAALRSHGLVALSGCLLGIGVGLKYTLASYGVGFAVAILADHGKWWRRASRFAVWGAAALTGLLLSAGHWMYRLQKTYHSPLFPYWNGVFESPYVEPVNFMDDRWVPKTWLSSVQLPFLATMNNAMGMELAFTDIRYAVVFVLAAVALITWGAQRLVAGDERDAIGPAQSSPVRWLFVFFFVSYVVWMKQFAVYRYAVALEMLAPVAICLLLAKIASDQRHLLAASASVFAIGALTVSPPDWGRMPWGDKFIDIKTPKFERPNKSLVLMTSLEPMSYAIPAFPREVRFVRIESNFHGPQTPTMLAKQISEILREPGYDYFLLTTDAFVEEAPQVLLWHGLAMVEHSCTELESNMPDHLVLCDVVNAPAPHGGITADPNPVELCDPVGFASTKVSWSTVGTPQVEIRLGSPTGELLGSGGPSGSLDEAKVTKGAVLYLQNAGPRAPKGEASTLAKVMIETVPGACPQ